MKCRVGSARVEREVEDSAVDQSLDASHTAADGSVETAPTQRRRSSLTHIFIWLLNSSTKQTLEAHSWRYTCLWLKKIRSNMTLRSVISLVFANKERLWSFFIQKQKLIFRNQISHSEFMRFTRINERQNTIRGWTKLRRMFLPEMSFLAPYISKENHPTELVVHHLFVSLPNAYLWWEVCVWLELQLRHTSRRQSHKDEVLPLFFH